MSKLGNLLGKVGHCSTNDLIIALLQTYLILIRQKLSRDLERPIRLLYFKLSYIRYWAMVITLKPIF